MVAENWRCPNSPRNPLNQKSDENKENTPLPVPSLTPPRPAAPGSANQCAVPETPKPATSSVRVGARMVLGRVSQPFTPTVSSPLSKSLVSQANPSTPVTKVMGGPSFRPEIYNPYSPSQASRSTQPYISALSNPYLLHSFSATASPSSHQPASRMLPTTPNHRSTPLPVIPPATPNHLSRSTHTPSLGTPWAPAPTSSQYHDSP